MQIHEGKLALVMGTLILVESTGIGMGVLDVFLRPFTNWIDSLLEDRQNPIQGPLLALRSVLRTHEKLRDQAPHYWPKVLDEGKKNEMWGEQLDLRSTPSLFQGKKKERVYPHGDSELYTSRVSNANPPRLRGDTLASGL